MLRRQIVKHRQALSYPVVSPIHYSVSDKDFPLTSEIKRKQTTQSGGKSKRLSVAQGGTLPNQQDYNKKNGRHLIGISNKIAKVVRGETVSGLDSPDDKKKPAASAVASKSTSPDGDDEQALAAKRKLAEMMGLEFAAPEAPPASSASTKTGQQELTADQLQFINQQLDVVESMLKHEPVTNDMSTASTAAMRNLLSVASPAISLSPNILALSFSRSSSHLVSLQRQLNKEVIVSHRLYPNIEKRRAILGEEDELNLDLGDDQSTPKSDVSGERGVLQQHAFDMALAKENRNWVTLIKKVSEGGTEVPVDVRTLRSRLWLEASTHDNSGVEATTSLFKEKLKPHDVLRFGLLAAADEVYPSLDRAWQHVKKANALLSEKEGAADAKTPLSARDIGFLANCVGNKEEFERVFGLWEQLIVEDEITLNATPAVERHILVSTRALLEALSRCTEFTREEILEKATDIYTTFVDASPVHLGLNNQLRYGLIACTAAAGDGWKSMATYNQVKESLVTVGIGESKQSAHDRVDSNAHSTGDRVSSKAHINLFEDQNEVSITSSLYAAYRDNPAAMFAVHNHVVRGYKTINVRCSSVNAVVASFLKDSALSLEAFTRAHELACTEGESSAAPPPPFWDTANRIETVISTMERSRILNDHYTQSMFLLQKTFELEGTIAAFLVAKKNGVEPPVGMEEVSTVLTDHMEVVNQILWRWVNFDVVSSLPPFAMATIEVLCAQLQRLVSEGFIIDVDSGSLNAALKRDEPLLQQLFVSIRRLVARISNAQHTLKPHHIRDVPVDASRQIVAPTKPEDGGEAVKEAPFLGTLDLVTTTAELLGESSTQVSHQICFVGPVVADLVAKLDKLDRTSPAEPSNTRVQSNVVRFLKNLHEHLVAEVGVGNTVVFTHQAYNLLNTLEHHALVMDPSLGGTIDVTKSNRSMFPLAVKKSDVPEHLKAWKVLDAWSSVAVMEDPAIHEELMTLSTPCVTRHDKFAEFTFLVGGPHRLRPYKKFTTLSQFNQLQFAIGQARVFHRPHVPLNGTLSFLFRYGSELPEPSRLEDVIGEVTRAAADTGNINTTQLSSDLAHLIKNAPTSEESGVTPLESAIDHLRRMSSNPIRHFYDSQPNTHYIEYRFADEVSKGSIDWSSIPIGMPQQVSEWGATERARLARRQKEMV